VQFLVIGCYTPEAGGAGVGLTVAARNPDSGALRVVGEPAPTPAPSFVAAHPTRPVVYAVNELTEGTVSAFAMCGSAMDSTSGPLAGTSDRILGAGTLTPLGTWPTGGAEPCHISVEPRGRHLLVANYESGSVATFALDDDGIPTHRASLVAHSGTGPHPKRQRGPHAHTVSAAAGGVLAVDLGVDTVFWYPLDGATGALGPAAVLAALPPGTGPRHLATSTGDAYLVGELAANLTTFRTGPDGWEAAGTAPTSTEPDALPSEIAVSADGRFLYVGNRGPATIAVFSLANGLPAFVGEVACGGAWPRHFALVGDHLYVANQLSHTVVVFRIDPATGIPVPTGDVLATPSPTCLLPWPQK
jgi:6-phosphogluconolactonase